MAEESESVMGVTTDVVVELPERVSEDHADLRGRLRSGSWTVNDGPSLTIQSDAAEADIQVIMRKFRQTGQLQLRETDALFMDLTEFTDYKDAMDQLRIAERKFMSLPSKVREIFDHDVAEWLDAAHDPEKRDALVAAGFLEPEPAPAPSVAEPGAEVQQASEEAAAGEAAAAASGSSSDVGS